MYEVHELLPGFRLIEGTAKVTRRSDAVLLLHTPHLHAHVAGFDDDHDSEGMQRLLDTLLDLKRHALLHLQTVGKDVHHAGYLRESGDIAVRDVGYVGLAIERQHVVFAEGEEVDVLDDDHLGIVLLKEGIGEHLWASMS